MRLFPVAVLQIACASATATAAAQTAPPCVPLAGRASVEVSIARSLADAEVTNALAEQSLDQDVRMKSGAGFSVSGAIPFGSTLSLRLDAARTNLAIDRQPAFGVSAGAARSGRLGSATLSYATAGVARIYAINRRLCFEAAAGLGGYRLRYADRGTTRPGVSGTVSVYAPVSSYAGLLFGFQFHAIFQDSQPPVIAETLFLPRLGAGVRFRF